MNFFKNAFFNLFKNKFLIKELRPETTKRELELFHYALSIKQKIGENWYFDIIELKSEYKEIDFGFSASSILIANDSENDLEFSWDGKKRAGLLHKKEDFNLFPVEREKVYIKGSGDIRIWSY